MYLLSVVFLMQCIIEMLLLPRAALPSQVQCILAGVPALGWIGNAGILRGKKYGIFRSFILAASALCVALVILFWGWSPHAAAERLHHFF